MGIIKASLNAAKMESACVYDVMMLTLMTLFFAALPYSKIKLIAGGVYGLFGIVLLWRRNK